MAPNMDHILASIVHWLSEDGSVEVEFVRGPDWQEQERKFRDGDLDAIWICGLPYVRMADDPDTDVELLAAPVMAGKRYRSKPVYFSDVVVRAEAEYRSFAELRGASWSYNEPGSHSGYNVVRAHLAHLGEDWSYFSEVVHAGSHQRSLAMILAGEIDASAVDTTVIDEEAKRDPGLRANLRVLHTLGPSPIPPIVAGASLSAERRGAIRSLLTELGEHSSKRRSALQSMGLLGFAPVQDRDYDSIRETDRQAAAVPPLTDER